MISRTPFFNQTVIVAGILNLILSCGLSLGFISSFLEQNAERNHLRFSSDVQKSIEIAGEIAFLPSIVIIPLLMQKKGRKIAIYATTLPLLLSWLISYDTKNVGTIITVNILHNVALGGAVATSSIIISEYCDPNYRATFLMLETAMMSLGILISHISGMLSCWGLISSVGILTTLTPLIATYFSPESPYWLTSQGHIIKAKECFYNLRGAHESALNELDDLLTTQKRKLQQMVIKPIRRLNLREKVVDYLKSLLKADFLKPLSTMILLFSFVGFSGENVVSNYSFRHVFNLANGKYIGTIILDVMTLICSLTACVLIQIIKRKTLFLFTGSFSLVFLAMTMILLILQSFEMFAKDYLWLVLSFITGFIMFMSLGTSALPFSILGELFPMSYKGIGSSLTCAYLWAFGNSILKWIPTLTAHIGVYGLLLLTLLSMSAILYVVNNVLPETHSKSLSEINELMKMSNCVVESKLEDNNTFDNLMLFIDV
ncbi:facilitated trehalose transporter Tret1-2 homolog [Plodia interpunctella]|uniref:facilitated trehalose transporter Tret1-2 homolog n=1 Tax=Plodia interpunctella TaxID=58824 RepID=UPI0023675586|nr:facilitated trehalose transporter Tret1-2 homolog [Plodia interpunctella]